MVAPVLALLLTVQVPQDGSLDVPFYVDTAFGVSVAQPAENWVFEPSRGRGITTILFSPRGASLRDQLWGALVLTTFDRDVALNRVADQRIASTWQADLGPAFSVLARDSISLLGLPTVHVVMTGEVGEVAFDVEEYLIARGGDLILLQFRYPRALPRAPLAAGYERALAGMRIRGAPVVSEARADVPLPPPQREPAPTPPGASPSASGRWRALAGSVWRADRVDAGIRLRSAGRPLEIEARIDLYNQGFRPLDALPLLLPPGARLDSVSVGGATAFASGASPLTVFLGDSIMPDGRVSVSLFYQLPSREAAPRLGDWLPSWTVVTDSVGDPVALAALPLRARFDVPQGQVVVATGRLISTLVSDGRQQTVWTAESIVPDQAAFVIGPFTPSPRRAGRLDVRLWVQNNATDAPSLDTLTSLVASGWGFYSRAFGAVGEPAVSVIVGAGRSAGGPAILFLSQSDIGNVDVVLRNLARTWWGAAVQGVGEGAALINEGMPAWSAVAARGVIEDDSVRQRAVREAEEAVERARAQGLDRPLARAATTGPAGLEWMRAKSTAAIESARRAAGEARFREGVRTLAAGHRGMSANAADLLSALGPAGASALLPYLYGRN